MINNSCLTIGLLRSTPRHWKGSMNCGSKNGLSLGMTYVFVISYSVHLSSTLYSSIIVGTTYSKFRHPCNSQTTLKTTRYIINCSSTITYGLLNKLHHVVLVLVAFLFAKVLESVLVPVLDTFTHTCTLTLIHTTGLGREARHHSARYRWLCRLQHCWRS